MLMTTRRTLSCPGAAAATASVRLERITKRFGDVVAADRVSIDVTHGEFITLLGPSGCGKTTLLNLIAGHIPPDEGEIVIDGIPMSNVPPYEREIGMVFQNYALFPHMTVGQNIAYGLKMRRRPKGEIADSVAAVLELVELEGMEDRKPRQLSGGQQQRVALARALVVNPRVLLLDEPFSALDKNLRSAMQVELRNLQRRLGVTTFLVTHDQSEALSLSDRIAVMSAGRILQIGSPKDVYRRPLNRFVASFVGDVSALRGEILEGGSKRVTARLGDARLSGPAVAFPEARSGAAADVFIRPEDVRVAVDGDPVIAYGEIAAQIFQGSHADIVVATEAALSGRVLMRRPLCDPAVSLPSGSSVALTLAVGEAAIFPPEIP